MSFVIKFIPVVLTLAVVVYLHHRLKPLEDVVGSYLEDTPARAKQLIRAAQHQRYRETWSRSDPE